MQGRPDFRLYHGNALDVLAGVLAVEVARLPADGDWLRPDIVLVPQFSMRRWLQQALADLFGIRPAITCVVREARDNADGPTLLEIVDDEDPPSDEEALRRVQEMFGAQVTAPSSESGD